MLLHCKDIAHWLLLRFYLVHALLDHDPKHVMYSIESMYIFIDFQAGGYIGG